MFRGVRLSVLALIGLWLASSSSAQAAFWPSTALRIERDLHGPDVELRRRAAQSLRDLPPSSGARLSRAALDDSDVDVRLSALDACLALGVSGLGDQLLPWLTDGERRLRLAAAEALSESPSPRAVSPLGRALGDADLAVRSAAARALGSSGSPEAVLALLGHLDDSAPEVRRDVALALGDLGDRRAVVPLIGKIQDARASVREGVAQALAELGDARAVSALVLSLHDPDDSVKIAALGALSRLGDPSTVASINALARNGAESVVPRALDALSALHTPAATQALIEALDSERSSETRAVAAQALTRSGSSGIPALTACLNAESDPERLAGCALVLGRMHAAEGAASIQDALRRGALRPVAALLALAELGAPESLPTVLEYLSANDVLERKAARLAAKGLLDPRFPDGRAVEPIDHALFKARRERREQSELLDLLGETGSPRALGSLLSFAGPGDDPSLRSHALLGLGLLGDVGQFPALRAALDDDAGSVRLAAALALGRLVLPEHALSLLDRLQQSSDQDRPLLLLALGGTASQSSDPRVSARLLAFLRGAVDGERDALIELIGRIPRPEVTAKLAELVRSSNLAGDRAKLAEALAAHPAERGRLLPMLSDPSAAVRANAAWALGEVGTLQDRATLEAALRDADIHVAGNALQAMARIAFRNQQAISAWTCPWVGNSRSALRAYALRALHLTGERCSRGEERLVLSRDRWDFARQSAAAVLRDVSRGAEDREALSYAEGHDPSGAVAAECAAPPLAKNAGFEPTVILVIPAGDDVPRATQPFALLRADGLVRLGISDRRGQVFEGRAPHGSLSLIEPTADFE